MNLCCKHRFHLCTLLTSLLCHSCEKVSDLGRIYLLKENLIQISLELEHLAKSFDQNHMRKLFYKVSLLRDTRLIRIFVISKLDVKQFESYI